MNFKNTIIAAALASVCSCSVLAAAVEGTDYVVLDTPMVNAQGKLTKIFSYDCPFCYKYDVGVDPKVVPAIEAAGLAFSPVHLETKGKYGRLASEFLAMCLIKDQAAGVSIESQQSLFKKAKDAIYKAYHRKGERWSAGADAFVATLTQATGISADEFEKAKSDSALQELCAQWKTSYDVAKIQGIPAYVVNGKYLLMTKSIRSHAGMIETIKELQAK